MNNQLRERSRPAAGRRVPPQKDDPYWDIRLSAWEWLCLLAAVVLTALLHLAPFVNVPSTVPLTVLLAVISLWHPVTGFFYISVSQYLPTAEGTLFNPTQLGAIVWLPIVLIRYHRLSLKGISSLLVALPWLGWLWLLTQEPIYLPTNDYFKALCYAVIACQLANESKGQYLKCLLGLCLGSLLVTCAFWALQAGLPVKMREYGGIREGYERIGSVTADAVMVWPAILMGLSGIMGTIVCFASRQSRNGAPPGFVFVAIAAVLMGVPALVATMTHGAYAGFALIVIAFVWMLLRASTEKGFVYSRLKPFFAFLGASLAFLTLLFATNSLGMTSRVEALWQYYSEVKEESGVAASRTDVWGSAIKEIMSHPFVGISLSGEAKADRPEEYMEQGGYLAHNVFLDYGRYAGLPGMLLVIFFFFYPFVKMWKSSHRIQHFPFLLTHFAALIFWMSLSFQFYKSFWALWMLMTMAARPRVRVAASQRRPGSTLLPNKPATIVPRPQEVGSVLGGSAQ